MVLPPSGFVRTLVIRSGRVSRSFQTHAFCEPSRPLAGVRAASAWHEERHTRARSCHRPPRRQVLTTAIVCRHRSEPSADLSATDLSRRHHWLEVFWCGLQVGRGLDHTRCQRTMNRYVAHAAPPQVVSGCGAAQSFCFGEAFRECSSATAAAPALRKSSGPPRPRM